MAENKPPRQLLCLGGHLDGQWLTIRGGQSAVHFKEAPDPRTLWDAIQPTEPLPEPRVWTYVVETIAMFGREFRVAALQGLTPQERDDRAWTHLASETAKMAEREMRTP